MEYFFTRNKKPEETIKSHGTTSLTCGKLSQVPKTSSSDDKTWDAKLNYHKIKSTSSLLYEMAEKCSILKYNIFIVFKDFIATIKI